MKQLTILPLTLFRVQARLPVTLRSYDSQLALGRPSFDLKLRNGIVIPVPPNSPFKTPNGMSLRPASDSLRQILLNFRGNPHIYTLLTGLKLPDGLCVYHEHTDHYSLQTTIDIKLDQLNENLTQFLKTLPYQTKEQFLEMLDDVDDQDC
jgi:hypothetical protein